MPEKNGNKKWLNGDSINLAQVAKTLGIIGMLVIPVGGWYTLKSDVLQNKAVAGTHTTRSEHYASRDLILEKLSGMEKRLIERNEEMKRRLTFIENKLDRRRGGG